LVRKNRLPIRVEVIVDTVPCEELQAINFYLERPWICSIVWPDGDTVVAVAAGELQLVLTCGHIKLADAIFINVSYLATICILLT